MSPVPGGSIGLMDNMEAPARLSEVKLRPPGWNCRYELDPASAVGPLLRERQHRVVRVEMTGEQNTISQRGDAKQGLRALERSGIGSRVLSPIEIITRGSDPALLAQRLHAIAGLKERGPQQPSAGGDDWGLAVARSFDA
jgi:hypothetical protein